MALAVFKTVVGPVTRIEVGSIPILSANSISMCRLVRSHRQIHPKSAIPKGGDPHVARANSQTDVALVLRRLSFQVEPTGPVASFASATAVCEIRTSSSVPSRADDAGVFASIATAPWSRRSTSSPPSWTTRFATVKSPRPMRSPTFSQWAAVRSLR